MAYIPPHKRHSNGNSSPLKPELMRPLYNKKKLNNAKRSPEKDIYAKNSISRWLAVGFDGDDSRTKFPPSVTLQPVMFNPVKREVSEKHRALILNELAEDKERVLGEPWVYVAENVVEDLIRSFKRVRSEMGSDENEELRPTLEAWFGKIIFRREPSFNREDLACKEYRLRDMIRVFHTSIPKSYKEYIVREGVQKIGFEFEDDKDVYHVKVSDSTRPKSTLSCKCRVLKERKLEVCKIELLPVERHMVIDISCTDKNVDVRLMLRAKRKITYMSDDDERIIRGLINSAVLDGVAKGGLRWSLGGRSFGNRFCVVGVRRVETKSYASKSMRLKVVYADRYNFKTSSGRVSWEMAVKFKEIASKLKEQNVDENAVKKTLEGDLRVLWGSLFCTESFLNW